MCNKNETNGKSARSYRGGIPKLGAMLILILLCIYPYVQLVKYIDFCFHKNQVDILQTTCEGFTWDDNNGYYNGVDYLNFSVEVSFKQKEVVCFDAHTLVFKQDKYVGYIKSCFMGTSQRIEEDNTQSYFERKSTQKLYFYISHPTNTSWQGHGLFKELYNGNLQDYTFVTNVLCVYFTDGTMVGHYLNSSMDFYYDDHGVIHFKDENNDRYYYYDKNGIKRYDKD